LWDVVRLTDLLTPDRVRVPLQASDKEGVLRELVGLLLPDDGASEEEVLAAVMERERQFPTGIGHGVAVPHGRSPAMAGLSMVAGTSASPVRYETIDGQPVRLFFLVAGPETMAGAYVKTLSRISRLVRREGVRSRLLAARTPQEFYQAISEAEGA
jgi:mannitol/fructose-specific phosphotransferase system IIA component (Ntr-type)